LHTKRRWHVGRFLYRLDVAPSGRWMIVRERIGPDDDEVVVRGRCLGLADDAELLAVAVEELRTVAQCIEDEAEAVIDPLQ